LGPDYTAHLDSGKHVLMIGGSGDPAFQDYISGYLGVGVFQSWHTAEDCMTDWNTGAAHPMTTLLPAQYEFPEQSASYHMVHFADAGQPNGVTLLGRTCHSPPDNHVLATRAYNNGGTFTYMALDLGPYADGIMQDQFVVPFLQGYFNWLQTK
jgi:hypothetical protein